MHATQSEWGGHLDMLSMYLVAGFAAEPGRCGAVRFGVCDDCAPATGLDTLAQFECLAFL